MNACSRCNFLFSCSTSPCRFPSIAPSTDDRVLSVACCCCCRFSVAAPAPSAPPPLACNLNNPVPLLRLTPPTRQQSSKDAGVQPGGTLTLPTEQGVEAEVTRLPRAVLVPPGVEMKDSAVEMSAIKVLAAAAAWLFIFPSISDRPPAHAFVVSFSCWVVESSHDLIAGGGSWKNMTPACFIVRRPIFHVFLLVRFGVLATLCSDTEAKDASTCVVGSAPCADVGLGVQLSLWGGLRRHSKC